jgi:steroid delta-isomerase
LYRPDTRQQKKERFMATREEIVAVCDQYVALLSKADAEGIVALYAPDAQVEDPLGTPKKNGHAEIRAFYESFGGTPITATRLGPVTVVGLEAAFQFRVDVDLGSETVSMVTTDLMTFNDNAQVVSMTAYADMEAKPGT